MRPAPEGMAATAIALIVGRPPSATDAKVACAFIRRFPQRSPAALRISAPPRLTKELLELAEAKQLPCSFLPTPEQAIRTANLAVIVGRSPWTAREVEIIEEQGVVVEWKGRYIAGRGKIVAKPQHLSA